MSEESLWGDDFVLPKEKDKVKKIINKIAKPKKEKEQVKTQLKSKKITLEERLDVIDEEVKRVLEKQKDNIICITDINSFRDYINKCIDNGRIDIDTETNNSLDPITCKLMGLCLYYPGGKQAYIPINHRDPKTKIRLSNQLTEEDVKNELERCFNDRKKWNPDYPTQSFLEWTLKHVGLNRTNPYGPIVIMHNGKFDYAVIKCTCNEILPIDWDTMIGCKLIDENERSAGLKQQYISKIDPEQEKYSIDELFDGVEYADVNPNIFAYYAATDSLMTDKLFEYQMKIMLRPDFSKVLNLAFTKEMPLVKALSEMEMVGMAVDQDYAELLSKKFHIRLDLVDNEINDEMLKLKPQIDTWRLSPEAHYKPFKKGGNIVELNNIKYEYVQLSYGSGEKSYWINKSTNKQLTDTESKELGLSANSILGKSKSEQLADPINLASPTQLAILFYDILKAPIVDPKQPRATGEDALNTLAEKTSLPICKLLIERRGLLKLITTYIDVIPELAKRWPDGRVRTHFNQYGAATGRLSSSDPINFQNIPSHEKTIRMLFCAPDKFNEIELTENYFEVPEYSEVQLNNNDWIYPENLKINDVILLEENKTGTIIKIEKEDNNYKLYLC